MKAPLFLSFFYRQTPKSTLLVDSGLPTQAALVLQERIERTFVSFVVSSSNTKKPVLLVDSGLPTQAEARRELVATGLAPTPEKPTIRSLKLGGNSSASAWLLPK